MNQPQWHIFDDKVSFIASLVEAASEILSEQSRPQLLLSGGSTPGLFYAALGRAALDWSRTTIGLVDERWVDLSAPGSNEALMRQTLNLDAQTGVSFVGMKTHHARPHDAIAEVNHAYQALAHPSLTILGMGPDAHTASWFAEAPEYDAASSKDTTSLVCAVTAPNNSVTNGYVERMTITGAVLDKTAHSFLIIQGKEKIDLLRQCLAASADATPIGRAMAILGQRLRIFALEE